MYKLILVSIFLIFSCSKEKVTETLEPKKPKNEYIGTWENKGKWRKWMIIKVTLFDNNKFECWFESDRKLSNPKTYPIEGTYKIDNSILTLYSDRDDDLYSKEYKILEENGVKVLLSTSQLQNWETESKVDCHPLYKTTK